MGTLAGRKIALLEHRHREELAALVERLGGVPISAPAVGEIACHDNLRTFVNGLINRRFSIAVFLSGAGPAVLLAEAERRGRRIDIVAALRQVTIACRGAKSFAPLKRYGLRAQSRRRPRTRRTKSSRRSARSMSPTAGWCSCTTASATPPWPSTCSVAERG